MCPRVQLLGFVRALVRITGTRDTGSEIATDGEDEHLRSTGLLHVRLDLSGEVTYCLISAVDEPLSPARLQAAAVAEAAVLVLSAEEGIQTAEIDALKVLCGGATAPSLTLMIDNADGDPDLTELVVGEVEDHAVAHEASETKTFVTSLDALIECECASAASCLSCGPALEAIEAANRRKVVRKPLSESSLLLPSLVYERVSVSKKGRIAQPVPFGLLTAGSLSVGEELAAIGGDTDVGPLPVKSLQVFGESRQTVTAPAFVTALLDGAKPKDVGPPHLFILGVGHPDASAELVLEAVGEIDWGRAVPGRLRIVTPAWTAHVLAIEGVGESGARVTLDQQVCWVGQAACIDEAGLVLLSGPAPTW